MEKIIVIVIIKIYVIAIIIYCYAMIKLPKNHYVFKLENRRINLGLRVTMVHFTVVKLPTCEKNNCFYTGGNSSCATTNNLKNYLRFIAHEVFEI